jgi:N-acetylmuramoyl-L-alanine amidase
MDAHTIGVTRAGQDRMILLVVPPEATTAAAAEIAMAMAADAANGAGPADILAAAGIGGEDPGPISPQRHL